MILFRPEKCFHGAAKSINSFLFSLPSKTLFERIPPIDTSSQGFLIRMVDFLFPEAAPVAEVFILLVALFPQLL